jgi:hypothetical protein
MHVALRGEKHFIEAVVESASHFVDADEENTLLDLEAIREARQRAAAETRAKTHARELERIAERRKKHANQMHFLQERESEVRAAFMDTLAEHQDILKGDLAYYTDLGAENDIPEIADEAKEALIIQHGEVERLEFELEMKNMFDLMDATAGEQHEEVGLDVDGNMATKRAFHAPTPGSYVGEDFTPYDFKLLGAEELVVSVNGLGEQRVALTSDVETPQDAADAINLQLEGATASVTANTLVLASGLLGAGSSVVVRMDSGKNALLLLGDPVQCEMVEGTDAVARFGDTIDMHEALSMMETFVAPDDVEKKKLLQKTEMAVQEEEALRRFYEKARLKPIDPAIAAKYAKLSAEHILSYTPEATPTDEGAISPGRASRARVRTAEDRLREREEAMEAAAQAKLRKARAVALLDEDSRVSLKAAERQLVVDMTAFANRNQAPVDSTVKFTGYRGEIPEAGSERREEIEWSFKKSMADSINMRGLLGRCSMEHLYPLLQTTEMQGFRRACEAPNPLPPPELERLGISAEESLRLATAVRYDTGAEDVVPEDIEVTGMTMATPESAVKEVLTSWRTGGYGTDKTTEDRDSLAGRQFEPEVAIDATGVPMIPSDECRDLFWQASYSVDSDGTSRVPRQVATSGTTPTTCSRSTSTARARSSSSSTWAR